MTFGKWKSLAAAAGLAVVAAASSTSSASAACLNLSYVDVGCFTQVAAVNETTGADVGFIALTSPSGNTGPSLTLMAAVNLPIFAVTFDFASLNPFKITTVSIDGFTLQSGLATTSGSTVNKQLTFASSVGLTQLVFRFANSSGNNTVEVGNLVLSQAPAPIPGAGFLSFLSVAFAGMWRRGRSMASRVLRRRIVATA